MSFMHAAATNDSIIAGIRMMREDLTRELLIRKAAEKSSETAVSIKDELWNLYKTAARGKPMPWEVS